MSTLPTAKHSAKLTDTPLEKKLPTYHFGIGHPMSQCADDINKASVKGDCSTTCSNLTEDMRILLREYGYNVNQTSNLMKDKLTEVNWCHLTNYKLINQLKRKWWLSW